MKYILQVFTGPWSAANEKAEAIMEKIGGIASRIPVDKVIIGWSANPSLYKNVGALLRGMGIKMLLWLPVFSEIKAVSQPD